jgi:hypothetical protein
MKTWFSLLLSTTIVFTAWAQLPMFDADLQHTPHIQTKGELAQSTGVMGVTDIMNKVQGAMVIEYYASNTGDFLGFAGDTSQFDWHKLPVIQRIPVMRRLVKEFGPVQTLRIYRGELVRGLSKRDVIEIMGKPVKKKSRKGKQFWTYPEFTLVIDNNSVAEIRYSETKIQDVSSSKT